MTKDEITTARNQLVVKSNILVQNAKYDINLCGQKLILFAISLVKPNDEAFKRYSMSVKDVCEILQIEYIGANYRRLRETIKEIADKSFYLETPNGDYLVRWMDHIRITPDRMYIEFMIYDELKPYLLELKNNYTLFELSEVLRMQSKYAIRIYELLKSNLYKREYECSIEELRKLLGIEKDMYDQVCNFRARVIDPAMIEINVNSRMDVEYKTVRTGRKVTHLHFYMSPNNSKLSL